MSEEKSQDAAENANETEVVQSASGPNEEPKMTPLQRVKAQQAALQSNRKKGARQATGRSEESAASDGPTQRVQIQRRSGGA